MPRQRLKSANEAVKPEPSEVVPLARRGRNTALQLTIAVLLDLSPSMDRKNALEQALGACRRFFAELDENERLKLQLSFSLVGFSDRSHVIKPYGPVEGWDVDAALRDLPRGSSTRIGEAVVEHLADLDRYLASLRANAVGVRGSLVFLITDGGHNGSPEAYEEACRKAREFASRKNCRIFGIGVEGADMELLARLTPEPVALATVESFKEFWDWLLVTAKSISESGVNESVEIKDPFVGPDNEDGWANPWKRF